MSRFRLAIFIVLLLSLASCSTEKIPTEPNLKVAFIGDQGTNENSRLILELILSEKAELIIHQGDLDYYDTPSLTAEMYNEILGEDFPFVATVGNHNSSIWKTYQELFQARIDRIDDLECFGDLGINSYCTYKGLFFILSGVGTTGSDHLVFMENALRETEALWKVCSWHKNQRLMQVGKQPDEVGWEAYEKCREYGAIIATGHEHSYSRTHLLSNMENQEIVSQSSDLMITSGRSFAFVNGLGGQTLRYQNDELANNPWWASVYSATQNANYGVLFCTFGINDKQNHANCYFKDLDGQVVDEFNLINDGH